MLQIFMKLEGDCLSAKKVNVENSSLSSAMDSLKRPFEVLASSSSATQDLLQKLTQINSQNLDKGSKSFKKIPTKYQKMLLTAASVNDVIVSELEPSTMEFFGSSSPLNAQIILNSLLETGRIECSISPAMANCLMHGNFTWIDPLTPSGFASSVITTENIIRKNLIYEGMVLDYSTKYEMSEKNLSKLTKTQILYPNDIEGMIYRIEALQTLSKFFFGELSYINQGLVKLFLLCLDNKNLLKTKLYLDQSFVAKFLCAVDDRVNQWLMQCSSVHFVSETSLDLVDFSSLFTDVQHNRFHYILSPNISKVSKDHSKKQKITNLIINENLKKELKLREQEKWESVFRGKSNDGPKLSLGCKPCLKFHVKGRCFDDCRNKNSHKILNSEDEKKTSEYIKTLRGE